MNTNRTCTLMVGEQGLQNKELLVQVKGQLSCLNHNIKMMMIMMMMMMMMMMVLLLLSYTY